MAPKNEREFQTLLWLALRVAGTKVASEVRTATGRIDLVTWSPTTAYVVELKYGRSAREAIDVLRGTDGRRRYFVVSDNYDRSGS